MQNESCVLFPFRLWPLRAGWYQARQILAAGASDDPLSDAVFDLQEDKRKIERKTTNAEMPPNRRWIFGEPPDNILDILIRTLTHDASIVEAVRNSDSGKRSFVSSAVVP
jgi:hypothetical protein